MHETDIHTDRLKTDWLFLHMNLLLRLIIHLQASLQLAGMNQKVHVGRRIDVSSSWRIGAPTVLFTISRPA
jgi:hypothetical protein